MPTQTFEAVIASHLRTATHRPMDEQTLATYLDQWKGATGQKLYLQKDALLNEDDTAEFEPLLPSITVPLRIVWGENDAWLPPRHRRTPARAHPRLRPRAPARHRPLRHGRQPPTSRRNPLRFLHRLRQFRLSQRRNRARQRASQRLMLPVDSRFRGNDGWADRSEYIVHIPSEITSERTQQEG
jgi:hypothetical protein